MEERKYIMTEVLENKLQTIRWRTRFIIDLEKSESVIIQNMAKDQWIIKGKNLEFLDKWFPKAGGL